MSSTVLYSENSLAPADGVVTPPSNTGLFPHNLFEVGVDTVTVVLRKVATAKGANDIKRLIERTFSEQIDFATDRPTFMMCAWDGCSRGSLRGTQLHWQAPEEYGFGVLRVHLPGKALSAATSADAKDCLQVLWELYGGTCSRIDVAADDYEKITNLEDIAEAQRARNYTGVRSHRYTGSGSLHEKDGLTYYFGSKTSDSQLRIYDKAVESKGIMDCIRWELQLRREKANALCDMWLGLGDCGDSRDCSVLSGAIAGAVDFIDRAPGHKDLTRCKRLPWWERVRGCLASAFRVRPKKKVPLMAAKIGWICQSVLPSLAAVKKYLGDAEFWGFLDDGVREKSAVLSGLNLAVVTQAIADDEERAAVSACGDDFESLARCDIIFQQSIAGL